MLTCLFWRALDFLSQNVILILHFVNYHLFWHPLRAWRRGWSYAALNVHPASHQRIMAWPNCVKPISTRSLSLFSIMAWLVHRIMVTSLIPHLHWWKSALPHNYYSQHTFLLLVALLPVPLCPWLHSTSESGKCSQAAKKWESSRDKIIWNMSKWRGHAWGRYSWKVQTEAEREDVLLKSKNATKMSNHGPDPHIRM